MTKKVRPIRWFILVIYILIGMGIAFATVDYWSGKVGLASADCVCPLCPDCNCYFTPTNHTCNPSLECPNLSHLQLVALGVSNLREYERDVWDCENMALELDKRLKEWGYDSHYECNGRHCWVEVDNVIVESTSGTIMKPSAIKENGGMYD